MYVRTLLLLLLVVVTFTQTQTQRCVSSSFAYALSLSSQLSVLFNRKDAILSGLEVAITTTAISPELTQKLTSLAKSFDNRTPDTLYLRNNGILKRGLSSSTSRRIQIPSVGYSLYKTKDNIDECVRLALFNGCTLLDLATQYGTNEEVGKVLCDLQVTGENVPTKTMRDLIFLHHKISNNDQSADKATVKKNVKREMKNLGLIGDGAYLDLVSIHSPLTDKERRMNSYKALLELQEEGIVKAVGVCNYGVSALNEIIDAGMPSPTLNQIELSPFNQHRDIVEWAEKNDMKLSCAAWSKLSSVTGPQKEWDVLARIAKDKGATKCQILIRWAIQKGYNCVPRSGVGSKIEKFAVLENSLKGIKRVDPLSDEELALLDALDVNLKAGHLGRKDGWVDSDVTGDDWDPTNI